MELGHILWPSDQVTLESSDPETQLTRWPCSIMNSSIDLCCRQTFAMGKRFASFYRCLAFTRFWSVKFWRSFIKCLFQWRLYGFSQKYISLYLYLRLFSKTGKTRVSHRVKMMTRWPGDPDVKDDPNDPLTRWPNDPVPCLLACLWQQFFLLFLLFLFPKLRSKGVNLYGLFCPHLLVSTKI